MQQVESNEKRLTAAKKIRTIGGMDLMQNFEDFWPVGVEEGELLFRDPNFDARQSSAKSSAFLLRSATARKFQALRLLDLLKNLEIFAEARQVEFAERAGREETLPPAVVSPPPPSTSTHRQIPHLALQPRLAVVPFAVPCR